MLKKPLFNIIVSLMMVFLFFSCGDLDGIDVIDTTNFRGTWKKISTEEIPENDVEYDIRIHFSEDKFEIVVSDSSYSNVETDSVFRLIPADNFSNIVQNTNAFDDMVFLDTLAYSFGSTILGALVDSTLIDSVFIDTTLLFVSSIDTSFLIDTSYVDTTLFDSSYVDTTLINVVLTDTSVINDNTNNRINLQSDFDKRTGTYFFMVDKNDLLTIITINDRSTFRKIRLNGLWEKVD